MAKHRRSSAYPRGRQVSAKAVDEVARVLAGIGTTRDLLIEALHLVQDEFGHLSLDHLAAVAERYSLSQSEVMETASFYHHFRIDQPSATGNTVKVCVGPSCAMKNGAAFLENPETEAAPCMGACDRAPARLAAPTTDLSIPDEPKAFALLQKCLNGNLPREHILGGLEASGLRGMGGAGFPAAIKWKTVLGQDGPRYLVVNADEGEPGTFKDRFCLQHHPKRVLEGALIAAWTVKAEAIYIYLRDEYPDIRQLLQSVLAGIPDFGIPVHLRRGAGAYICGEESALLESLEGKRGLPRHKPPFPAMVGLFGRPTLIHNVETLYWLPYVLEGNGAGKRLYSVSGRIRKPGVVAAPVGVSVKSLIEDYCGGMEEGHRFAAYLPGGASGGILPADLGDVPLDFGCLEKYGCFVGSGAVVVLSNEDEPRDIALNLMRFFRDESCGQCTPCRQGTVQAAKMMEQRNWDIERLEDLASHMREASICGLGQAAPNPMMSVLRFFRETVS